MAQGGFKGSYPKGELTIPSRGSPLILMVAAEKNRTASNRIASN
jgi:hypothetical protein